VTLPKKHSFFVGDLVFYVGNQVQMVWGSILRASNGDLYVHYILSATTYQEDDKYLVPSVWSFAGPMPAHWRKHV
jgi:hypothetical protein